MPMQATTTTPLFAAELTPHRAIGTPGAWTLLGLGGLFATLAVLALVSPLPLPVVAALMAVVALSIGLSLFLSLRRGKKRERITIWSDQIEWAATDAKGDKLLRRFNPKTVRLVLDRDADEKTTTIHLRHGKDDLEVGTFLSADDKSSFAKALGTALRKARLA